MDTLGDPRLKGKRVGIVAGTPPGNNMAANGLMANAKPYPLVIDTRVLIRDRSLLERLLDRTGKRKQTLLDHDRYFADEVYGLAALIENACVPFGSIRQLVDPALVGIGSILKLTKLKDRGADLGRKFLLLAKIPLDATHHFAAFIVEGLEQSSK